MHLMACDLGASVITFASAYVAIDEPSLFLNILKMLLAFKNSQLTFSKTGITKKKKVIYKQ